MAEPAIKHATLTIGNEHVDLPLEQGTQGDRRVVRAIGLRAPFTGASGSPAILAELYSPGADSVASCKSGLTYIDGEAGVLQYRGYDIKDLAANSSYMEVCYLLLNGELPETYEDLVDFEQDMVANAGLPKAVIDTIADADLDEISTMDLFAAAMAQIPNSTEDRHLVAKAMSINALMTRKQLGYEIPETMAGMLDLEQGFTENYLGICFDTDDVTEAAIRAMDMNLILHADHEQNAGTAATRNVASTRASTKLSVVAGIGALSGELHGGANQKVLDQLRGIVSGNSELFKGEDVSGWSLEERVDFVVARAKDREDGFRLMGFGHRVYKNMDPRATVLKGAVDDVLAEVDSATDEQRDMLAVAKMLEERALGDEFFTSRGLYPNVDFYSGIMQTAMGFPEAQMTPNFGLARTVGWVAHKREQDNDPEAKLNRPRQVFVGPTARPYVSFADRDFHVEADPGAPEPAPGS